MAHRAKNEQSLSEVRVPRARLSAKNKAAIKLLDKWMSEPDDLGEEFWNEFMKELQEDRFTLHSDE